MAQSNNNIVTNSLVKGLQKDTNPSWTNNMVLSHHRNGMFKTINGDLIGSTNEPANLKCITLPYKYNGSVKLKDNRVLIFSTDNLSSEIGIADLSTCSYSKVKSAECLRFNTGYPITGFLRLNNDGEEVIIFTDGYNPDRVLNLSKIPYTYEIDELSKCKTKIYSSSLDCDEIKLNPRITIPSITTKASSNGLLKDGVYSISIAYLIDNQRFSDYYNTSTPIFINNKSGLNSIILSINNIDRGFDKYHIVVTSNIDGVKKNSLIGEYSTSQSSISITNLSQSTIIDGVPTSDIITKKKIWDYTGILAANSQYVLRGDIKRKPKVNYQKQAFNIEVDYVVKQHPLDYYKNGGDDVGYFRNENYNFVIRLYWDDGEVTEHFQIRGPKKSSKDSQLVSGRDIFENDKNIADCNYKNKVEYWEAYNTASQMKIADNDFICGSRIIGYGKTGYNESSFKYPDNIEVYGDLSCTNITNHRMPDEEKVPRYSVIDGVTYVNVIGVRFNKIERPVDENGKVISQITGYEILRSKRDEGNKTVISRGIFTNMAGYTDNVSKKTTLFTNFPYNSLEDNQYISYTQTSKKNNKREISFSPLTEYFFDKFTYITPYGKYTNTKSPINGYFNIESEEYGTAIGKFEQVKIHPGAKLMKNAALLFALLIGVIEGYFTVFGKVCIERKSKPRVINGTDSIDPSGATDVIEETLTACDSTYSIATSSKISAKSTARNIATIPARILQGIAKITGFTVTSANKALEVLSMLKSLVPYQNYVYQYNSQCLFNSTKSVSIGNKRRRVSNIPLYMEDGVHSYKNYTLNNYKRSPNIFVELSDSINKNTIKDNSRNTASGFGVCNNLDQEVESTASCHYVTNMVLNPLQYGAIDSFNGVKTHNNINRFTDDVDNSTDVIFGGDCIIYEQSHINRFPLFKQHFAKNEISNDAEYDYRIYNNIGYSRYWMDTSSYDFHNLASIFAKKRPTVEKLPSDKWNMDCSSSKNEVFVEKNELMYLSVNGVFRYIVEADYNASFRDDVVNEEAYVSHFSQNSQDLSKIFNIVDDDKKEKFSLNPSYFDIEQDMVYSEHLTSLPKHQVRYRNSISYSLPSNQSQPFNAWRYFLNNNFYSFEDKDFGNLTAIHQIDKDRLIFLFSESSPFISMGRDELQTDNGRKITIGDGGLFIQQPRELIPNDVKYASSHDKLAFKATQFGYFFLSRNQGKIFSFTGSIDEISRNGLSSWLSINMPLNLLKQFPNYSLNTPVNGVGYNLAFDNIYDTLYICKKDYSLKKEYDGRVSCENNKFYINSVEIALGDAEYFNNTSWTLSYNCLYKVWSSFHDWTPDAIIQDERHFYTIKDNEIWYHNSRFDLFCNYYGKSYPYELSTTITFSPKRVLLNSISYEQDAFSYIDENNRKPEIGNTFDYCTIYNDRRSSGLIQLVVHSDDTPTLYDYPKYIGNYKTIIPVMNQAGRHTYKFNQFRDYSVNKNINSQNSYSTWLTMPDGFKKFINPVSIDYSIRSEENDYAPALIDSNFTIWMGKEECGSVNYVNKFINFKINEIN